MILGTEEEYYKSLSPTYQKTYQKNEKNIEELNKIENVSGFLVGGASLDFEKVLINYSLLPFNI